VGADRPVVIVEIEDGGNGDDIHVGFVVGLEGAYVAPVESFFLVFVDEVVGENAIVVDHLRKNVFAEVVAGGLVLGVFEEDGDEDVGIEEVDAHGAGDFLRVPRGTQLGFFGLFFEAVDAAVFVDVDYAEAEGLGGINLDGSECDIGGGIEMLGHHLAVIHFVDVIAGEDEDMLGLLGAYGINVLINGVGGALIPLVADPLHGGKDLDELSDLAAEDVPAFADVAVERKGFVLGEDVNAAQVGVEAVGESDIDDAIHASEGDGGLGTVAGKRIKALSGAACEKDSESVFHGHGATPEKQ
jgi:hypothetical protein